MDPGGDAVMSAVSLDRASVITDGVRRLADVSLAIPEGVFVGVVGGSGSGKSTLLRAIAGLDRLAVGAVHFGGMNVTDRSPGERDVGLVFQSPALMGHRSVRRNVSFPLELRRQDAEEIRKRVNAEARALHIEELLHRDPAGLSHGEQQMVQIARSLVRVPRVLLLDEPFASLDEHLRHRMRAEIAMLQRGYGVTTIMTTNDPLDVTTLTAMLAVLDDGRLIQFDQTSTVQRSPGTLFAAAATGSLSVVPMTVVRDGTGYWLMRESPSAGELVRIRAWSPAFAGHVGSEVLVGLRPQHVLVADNGSVPATIERRIPIPPASVQCLVAGARITATSEHSTSLQAGDEVRLRIDHYVAFDKPTESVIG